MQITTTNTHGLRRGDKVMIDGTAWEAVNVGETTFGISWPPWWRRALWWISAHWHGLMLRARRAFR